MRLANRRRPNIYMCVCVRVNMANNYPHPLCIYTYIQIYILYTTNIYVCISKKNISHIVATLHRTNKSLEKVDVERANAHKALHDKLFSLSGSQDMFSLFTLFVRVYVYTYISLYIVVDVVFFFGFSVFANVPKKNIAQYFNYSIPILYVI